MAIYNYTFDNHKEKMERDIRAIQDFKDVELKYNEGVDKDEQRYRECIANSGIYKGEKLYYEYECPQCGTKRPIEGYCYELLEQKANAELEKLFESDVKEFSENFAEKFGHILAKHGIDNPQKWFEEKMRMENAELEKLFESDIKKIAEFSSKRFGHVLAKHGIDNPQKWFEEKMRMENANTYTYAPYSSYSTYASYDIGRKIIKFSTFYNLTKFVRAHEMGHKISDNTKIWKYKNKQDNIGFHGLGVSTIKPCIGGIFQKNAIYYLSLSMAHGLDEGATNLFAEKLTEINSDTYKKETNIVRKIAEVVGEGTVFEALLFNPQILADKWKELSCDKYSFANIIYSIDYSAGANYARKEIKRVARNKNINRKGIKAINAFRNFVYFAFSKREEIYEALKIRIHCFLYSEAVPMPPTANERNSITNISVNDEVRKSSRQTLKDVHIKSEPEIDKEKNI